MTQEILHDLGFFGHYLHIHAGGRGGKQFVLIALHTSEGHMTQRELLERTNISPAALSEVVAKLESEGLIAREPCAHDRRQLLIQLTDKGTECATRMCEEREEFERQALSCFTIEEQENLKEMLHRLVEHWKQLEERKVNA